MKDILKIADFSKDTDGLLPAVIQHASTRQVLMLGYMNSEALKKTLETKNVWFYSRSKKRLWMKGETSNNILAVENIALDCDHDAILISANPAGPTCHTGQISCFGSAQKNSLFLEELFDVIQNRKENMPKGSYTASLFKEGLDRIIQKVGEEAVEVVIAAKNKENDRFVSESADLLFHLIILFAEKKISLQLLWEELEKRH